MGLPSRQGKDDGLRPGGTAVLATHMARAAAFRVVCRFIVSYDAPPKIVLQIYVSLLRWTPGPAVVDEACLHALDLLAAVLPARLNQTNEHAYPTWFKWLRKVLEEDGGTNSAATPAAVAAQRSSEEAAVSMGVAAQADAATLSCAPAGSCSAAGADDASTAVASAAAPSRAAKDQRPSPRQLILIRCWSHITRHADLYCAPVAAMTWWAQPALASLAPLRRLAQFLGCPYHAARGHGPTIRALWAVQAPYALQPHVLGVATTVPAQLARHVLWPLLAVHVRVARPVALFWQEQSVRASCAPGGAARKRDRAAFEADFMGEDQGQQELAASRASSLASCTTSDVYHA